jgi:hypothetical protein
LIEPDIVPMNASVAVIVFAVSEPDIVVEPVTDNGPVGITTVPHNVCVSSAASPN